MTGWSSASLNALKQAELLMRLRPLENEDCGEPSSLESERPLSDGVMASDWMASIPQRQRQVVELVVLEGLSVRRAGHALGISAATVRRRLRQGLAELRTCLLYTSPSPRDLSPSRMPSSA